MLRCQEEMPYLQMKRHTRGFVGGVGSTDLDQLCKVGVGDVCEADEGLPVLTPIPGSPLGVLLDEGVQLGLHLPVQLLQVELSLALAPANTQAQ